MVGASVVVFDLDGTLLDGDSASNWMRKRFAEDWRRLAFALLASTLALPLSVFAPTRQVGASILLWIASFGQSKSQLMDSFHAFAAQVAQGGKLSWRGKGVAALQQHLAQADETIIATAAPRWLAESLVAQMDFDVRIIGSDLHPFFGGWICAYHCRHEAKCAAIAKAGFGDRWSACYSDSADDVPILRRAHQAFLVNSSSRAQRRLRSKLPALQLLHW